MGRILVPESVAAEVASGSSRDPARLWLETPEGAACIVQDSPFAGDLLAWDLGAGETSVIAITKDDPKREALLDDAAARRCALVFGIRMRGTLSFVALAKNEEKSPPAVRFLMRCLPPVSMSR